jgi:hypothetical protein
MTAVSIPPCRVRLDLVWEWPRAANSPTERPDMRVGAELTLRLPIVVVPRKPIPCGTIPIMATTARNRAAGVLIAVRVAGRRESQRGGSVECASGPDTGVGVLRPDWRRVIVGSARARSW